MPAHVGVLLGDPRLAYSYSTTDAFGEQELAAVDHLKEALAKLAGRYRFTYFDDHSTLLDDLRVAELDLALNLCDTGYQNRWEHELNLPAYLELLGVPYTGAAPAGIVLSNDKALVSAAARNAGVAVPEQKFVDLRRNRRALPSRFPVLVKPNVSCGSLGITEKSVAHTPEEALDYAAWLARELDVHEVIVQEFLEGTEYTVGVLGNPADDFVVLPPLEIDYGGLGDELPPILTHGSKADPGSPYWERVTFARAQLDDDTLATFTESCAKLFGRLGFRDYARFDFRRDALGVPRLIDANVNPTWYRAAKMSLMSSWAGIEYHAMLEKILHAASRRSGLAA